MVFATFRASAEDSRPTDRTTMSKTSVFNSPVSGEIADGHVIGARHRINGVDPGAQEADAVFVLGPPVIFLEVLAVGPHVHEENGGVQRIFFTMLLGDDRLLDGVHAADRGAVAVVAVVQVPGAHALEPGDLQGLLVVRGPDQVAGKRPGGAQDALELQAGHHVGIMGVMIGPILLGIKGLEARGHDDRAHVQLQGFGTLAMGNRPGLAYRHALHTFGADAAIETAGCLRLGLGFGVTLGDLIETLAADFRRQGGHLFPGRPFLVFGNLGPAFVGLLAFGAAFRHVHAPKIAVDGLRGFDAAAHRFDGNPGAGVHITGGKDPGPGGLVGYFIDFNGAPARQLDAGPFQGGEVGFLADGGDDHVHVQDIFGTGDGYRGAAPGGIRFA